MTEAQREQRRYALAISGGVCEVIRRRWTKWAEENGVNAGTGVLK